MKYGVLVTPRQPLPSVVPQMTITLFSKREITPTLDNIQLDWYGSFKDSWNAESIALLAEEFLERIRAKRYPNIPLTPSMTQVAFSTIIRTKLQRVQQRHLNERFIATSADVAAVASIKQKQKQTQRQSRVYGSHTNVRFLYTLTVFICSYLCLFGRIICDGSGLSF